MATARDEEQTNKPRPKPTGEDDPNDSDPNNVRNNVSNEPVNKRKSENGIVFDYSDIELTEDMISLINLGLNFAVLPLKLDITQVLNDYKQYERRAIWQEFWFGHDEEEKNAQTQIFEQKKTNLPKNYTIPQGLKTFLGGVKSEIMDHQNRNEAKCNLSVNQIAAMQALSRL